jgi:hypothetical protein
MSEDKMNAVDLIVKSNQTAEARVLAQPEESDKETKTAGQSLTAFCDEIEKKIDKLFALIAPRDYLISKVSNHGVGRSNANGLLNR